jgi:hypothetical protein
MRSNKGLEHWDASPDDYSGERAIPPQPVVTQAMLTTATQHRRIAGNQLFKI